MFDVEKLKASFKAHGKLPDGVVVTFEGASVDDQPSGVGQPAALVKLVKGSPESHQVMAQRVFTEADQKSSKLAVNIKAFCERVA
jgi:hypothetical protein